ncbi:hypothetical protein H4696_000721 [Amycolatopsis lexingtonensis]|uniref:PPE family protein n=1 Tax=Amycolatopsis lexingtonensis TaxID=218822 RepID=A0ABR9HRS3_9PSEU|nr:hypothetical protein [Amycolatopsis lexingtonensis]MBE1493621.1 hypothetical protein [Amycolatopsis lexingtonensis]
MLFPWSNPRVRAAADRAGPASVHTTEAAERWSAGLAHQDVEARVVSLEDLVDLVHRGPGTGWADAAEAAQRVAMAHREVADLLHSVLNRLGSAWRGEAADAAGATTRAFGGALDTTEARYVRNGLNITEADHHYRRLHAELADLGPRPEKSLWDHVTPWDTDTEKAITAYNANAARYLEHYHAYAAQLDGQARALRYDDGDPAADGGRSSLPPADGDRTGIPATDRPVGIPAAAGGYGADGWAQPHSGYPATTAAGPEGSPAPTGPPAPPAAAPALASGPPFGTDPAGPGATSTTGFVPAEPPGWSPGTTAPAPPPAGSATGTVPPGLTGTFHATPAGPGNPRGIPPAPGNARGGAPGASPATSGSSRRSRRDGDGVHERKYVLDDGSLFTDEERYGWVDPATGQTTVDPTIGA